MDDKRIAGLLEKVKAMLHSSEKERLDHDGEAIVFDFNPWGQGPAARNKVAVLKQAIEAACKVALVYTNLNGVQCERVIEPISLILKGYVWYLHAYCTLRGDFASFVCLEFRNVHVEGHLRKAKGPNARVLCLGIRLDKRFIEASRHDICSVARELKARAQQIVARYDEI